MLHSVKEMCLLGHFWLLDHETVFFESQMYVN